MLRIGMLRMGEELLRRIMLAHLAMLHDIDIVGELPDDRQIVSD